MPSILRASRPEQNDLPSPRSRTTLKSLDRRAHSKVSIASAVASSSNALCMSGRLNERIATPSRISLLIYMLPPWEKLRCLTALSSE